MTIIKCAREEKNEFKRILWNFDSVYRHISRCGLCLFYEKRPEPVGTALSDRVCCGCHGSSVCVEPADPCT